MSAATISFTNSCHDKKSFIHGTAPVALSPGFYSLSTSQRPRTQTRKVWERVSEPGRATKLIERVFE